MKKALLSRLAVVACAAGTVVLGGRFKTDSKTTLNKDGSGVLTQRIELDMSKMKEVAEMFKGFAGDPGAAPGMDAPAMGEITPSDDAAAAKLKEDAKLKEMEDKIKAVEGLTLKDFTHETKDGKAVISYTIEFKEWSLLGKGGVILTSVELAKNADGSYTITLDPTSGKMGGGGGGAGGAAGGGEMPAGMDMGALAPMFEPFLGSLRDRDLDHRARRDHRDERHEVRGREHRCPGRRASRTSSRPRAESRRRLRSRARTSISSRSSSRPTPTR